MSDAAKEVKDIDLEVAVKKAEDLRNHLWMMFNDEGINCTPFTATLLQQALGTLEQTTGLLKQADMMRARELSGNF